MTLSTHRLLFEPVRTPNRDFMVKVAGFFGFGEPAGAINELIDAGGWLGPWSVPLHDLADVVWLPDGPKLRVHTYSGQARTFTMLHGRFAMTWSAQNFRVRDEAVMTLRSAIGAPTLAPVPVPQIREIYLAPPSSPAAALSPALFGTWQVLVYGELDGGQVALAPDGTLAGELWMVEGMPHHPIQGFWWVEPGPLIVWEYTASDLTGAVHVRAPLLPTYAAEHQIVALQANGRELRLQRV